jgi:3-ketosteroid 9alpha-monooxygenase subunit A
MNSYKAATDGCREDDVIRAWPFKEHPTGWHMVDWSWKLQPGEVKSLKLFGSDVVLYRTADGVVNMFDAYCPHLGAHLGHGGCVKGEILKCPWHGWEWGLEGNNTHIPYIEDTHTTATLKRWAARDVDGLVIVWYDAWGRPPQWEWDGVPEFKDTENYYSIEDGAHYYGVMPIKAQSGVENLADALHFPFVHGSSEPGEMVYWHEKGHYLRGDFKLLFGGGKEKTWLTPNGPTYGVIETESWGLGLGVARFRIEDLVVAQMICMTPVDDENSMVFSTIASTRLPGHPDKPGGRSKGLMDAQFMQVQNDFRIWTNQTYVQKPLFVGAEREWYVKLRLWARQFYTEPDPDNGDREYLWTKEMEEQK